MARHRVTRRSASGRSAPPRGGDPPPAPDPATFAPRLLAWFARHGRHDLPWQRDRSLYRVWVSEIMLQQTQVATVVPYYARFLDRFPDAATLAAAPLDEVLHHWSGLGYYARARNLHRAAQLIRDQHAGAVPSDPAALVALPGIGRSTAGAIVALARDQRQPILDGNVKRVLARWFGVEGFPGTPRVAERLWALSDAVTPASRAADFTQAVMDLGATLCTLNSPRCAACPLAADCRARASGRTAELPSPRPARARPRRRVVWLVLRRGDAVLLERRPPRGVWGGLWGFPEFATRAAAQAAAAARGGRGRPRVARLEPIRHAFTHFELEIEPLLVDVDRRSRLVEGAAETWYKSRAPAKLGLAAPVAALLAGLAVTVAAARG
jgi:A/G-specific adenine glycosylase